jgi:hypothetical protein
VRRRPRGDSHRRFLSSRPRAHDLPRPPSHDKLLHSEIIVTLCYSESNVFLMLYVTSPQQSYNLDESVTLFFLALCGQGTSICFS